MKTIFLTILIFFSFTSLPLLSKNVELEGIPLGNGYLPDEMSLSNVTFLGAHNSSVTKSDWLYYQQDVELKDQFNIYGVRAFKIPIHWYNPKGSFIDRVSSLLTTSSNTPYIALCHEPDGRSNCRVTRLQRYFAPPTPALEYLIKLRKLLEAHPKEVVILMVESYLSKKSEANGMDHDKTPLATYTADLIEQAGLTPYLYHLGDQYKQQLWPTLGELRQLNKRLIIISNEKKDGWDNVSLYRETGFEYSRDQLLQPQEEIMRGGGRDKTGKSQFFLMNHFTQWSIPNNTLEGFLLDLLPDLIPHAVHENFDVVNYDELNAYPSLMSRIERLKASQGLYPNIVLLDFVNKGLDGGGPRAVHELNLLQLSDFQTHR